MATNLGLNVKGTLAILKKLAMEEKIEIGHFSYQLASYRRNCTIQLSVNLRL